MYHQNPLHDSGARLEQILLLHAQVLEAYLQRVLALNLHIHLFTEPLV
jgi:hypothetical protein